MPFPSSRALRGAVLATALALTGSLLVAPTATAAPSAPIIQAATEASQHSYDPPTISGYFEADYSLLGDADWGDWDWIDLTYSWTRGGIVVPGASEFYVDITRADVAAGDPFVFRATYTFRDGSKKTLSSAPFSLPAFSTATAPSISGVLAPGSTLTAQTGSWSPKPDGHWYQWLRNGVAISGATSATYRIATTDVTTNISVRVTTKKFGYRKMVQTTSAKYIATATAFTAAPTPKIQGSASSGSKLTAIVGTWAPSGASHSFQWKRNGAAIAGATAKEYTVQAADAQKNLTVAVTGSRAGSIQATKTSAAVWVAKALTAAPTPKITGGAATYGTKITAQVGTWSPAPVTLKYQWKRNGSNISGATKASYVVTAGDMGNNLTVTVTGSKSGYQTVTRTSAGTPGLHKYTVKTAPKISGSAKVGSTLTATSGTWSTTGLSFSYQWKRNGSAISKATGSSYKVTASDTGKRITVTVTAKRSGHINVSSTSAATAQVPAATTFSGDRTWLVGSEIKAGTYITTATGPYGCSITRLAGFSGSYDDQLTWDYGYGQRIITIKSTDKGFSADGCGVWKPLSATSMTKKSTIPGNGILDAKRQITPGLYRSSGGGDMYCSWARTSSFTGNYADTLGSGYSTVQGGSQIVRISASDVGFETYECGTWTRIGN